MPECEGYQPGDLVTLRGVLNVVGPKPMVIRGRVEAHGHVSYEVRLLEDDLSNYRKGYSLTTSVGETEIVEGKCRSSDTRKWSLSPERAADRAMIGMKPPLQPMLSPSEFARFAGIVDTLLGELPEKRVEEFAKTPDMALYNKVIKGGYVEAERDRFVDVVDTLLGELPQKTVEDFVKTPDYEVYKKIILAVKKG